MALKQETIVMHRTDEDGNKVLQMPITTARNVEEGVYSVNGKTGDVQVGEIVDASINGKVITLTFADGTTKTLTTQDTGVTPKRYITQTYRSGTEWYEVYNDGWVRQGGLSTSGSNGSANNAETITFLKPFANTNYTLSGIRVMSGDTSFAEINGSFRNKTATSVVCGVYGTNSKGLMTSWVAEGQGA